MLVDLDVLLIFVPAALALNVTPGADMLFCLGQGLKSGPKAGIAASFGIAIGAMLHTIMAGLGLAVLIASYPVAFEVIRWAGVGYLVWLAVRAFREMDETLAPQQMVHTTPFLAWRNGILVCLLNPKVAIFILAFVPQFVDPVRGSTFLQFLVLGAIINVGGTLINGLVGGFAGSIGRVLATSRAATRGLRIMTGCIFFGLAARLAFERRS